jgi:hypothetical protein
MASLAPHKTNPRNVRECREANDEILGPLVLFQITHTKGANEIKYGDFLMINDRPCRVDSATFDSTTTTVRIIGHAIIHLCGEYYHRYDYARLEMIVGPVDQVQVPEIKLLFVGQLCRNGYLAIQDRPCKIIDIYSHKSGYDLKIHIIGKVIFIGKRKEDPANCSLLASPLEII